MEHQVKLLQRLKEYWLADTEEWQIAKAQAMQENAWFTDEYINLAVRHIADGFLSEQSLKDWVAQYSFTQEPKTIGLVCAGNIPLVGFHDFLCVFMSPHALQIKLSSKDAVLLAHIINLLQSWDETLKERIFIVEKLKDCDAYIATGSNNSARYFDYYFGKKPSIIRKNRTSVALLDGTETAENLHDLSDDVFTYFGLGCRNVTQLLVPKGYSFEPILQTFNRYDEMMLFHKYKNNFDYHLAIFLLNSVPVLTNDSILLVENEIPFSAVSVLHYRFYDDLEEAKKSLQNNEDIQCVVGKYGHPFGTAQIPSLIDYADGVDTMAFLAEL